MAYSIKKVKFVSLSLLLLGSFFFLGIYVGFNNRPEIEKITGIANKDGGALAETDFEPFWKVWNIINEKSPSAHEVTDQEKVWGSISGLVGSLNDPYSEFFNPKESKDFADTVNSSFDGVGMDIGIKDKLLTVIAPLKDTPAYRAGIKSGDVILKIDNASTADMSIDEAISKMRGPKGTTVRLTIFRSGEDKPLEISIVRDTIAIPTLDEKMRSDGVYVISLYNFGATATQLFNTAIHDFKASASTKLILDLRGNPGGFLDAAVDISSWFLPSGDVIVSEDFGSVGIPAKIYRSKGYDFFKDHPISMVILVDGGSASAAEILSGALQEHHVATLVGEKTYGKGSVQELIPVTDTTTLKLTIAKWLTPNGVSISAHGLTPDVVVKAGEKDVIGGADAQMDKAIEIVNNKK